MKAAYRILAVVPLVVLWAAAQDGPARLETVIQTRLGDLKQAKVMGIGGAVMGPAVKNAPYTAVEVTESTQVLGDGNRIHRLTETTVSRDSEGRVRRETPDQITIWDPVANVSYALDPKTQTARKAPVCVPRYRPARSAMTGPSRSSPKAGTRPTCRQPSGVYTAIRGWARKSFN